MNMYTNFEVFTIPKYVVIKSGILVALTLELSRDAACCVIKPAPSLKRTRHIIPELRLQFSTDHQHLKSQLLSCFGEKWAKFQISSF